MDSYTVFQIICLALVVSGVHAGDRVPCDLEEGFNARLERGANKTEGLVQVMCNGVWGTISDETWNDDLANAFCLELGFNGGEKAAKATIKGQGPVLEIQCHSNVVSIKECNFTQLESQELLFSDLPSFISSESISDWNHDNDVVLKCSMLGTVDFSKSNVQEFRGQNNIGQDPPDAVVVRAIGSDITLLLVLDGIELVLLLVAVVITGWIVYRKAIQKMNDVLKDKKSPENQAMLDLSHVHVQQPTAPQHDPEWEDQPAGGSGVEVMHNPSYGQFEKY